MKSFSLAVFIFGILGLSQVGFSYIIRNFNETEGQLCPGCYKGMASGVSIGNAVRFDTPCNSNGGILMLSLPSTDFSSFANSSFKLTAKLESGHQGSLVRFIVVTSVSRYQYNYIIDTYQFSSTFNSFSSPTLNSPSYVLDPDNAYSIVPGAPIPDLRSVIEFHLQGD